MPHCVLCVLQLLEVGERLIKAGLMYADDTPVDQMREERMAKVRKTTHTSSLSVHQLTQATWHEEQVGSQQFCWSVTAV
jgi:glutamyl-tRNA synthetase